MGYTYIRGFLDQGINRKQALTIHLQSNHYPPIHLDFLECAEKAIEACEIGDYSLQIDLPNGLVKTASEIVKGLHLGAFLEDLY